MLYFLCAVSSFPKIPRNHKLVLRMIKFRMSVTQYVISFWNTVPFPCHMLVPFSDGLLGPVWKCKMARPRSLFIFKSSPCGGWMPLRWSTQRSARALLSQDFIHSLFFRKSRIAREHSLGCKSPARDIWEKWEVSNPCMFSSLSLREVSGALGAFLILFPGHLHQRS